MNRRIVGDHHERSKKSAMAGRLLLVLMSGMPRNKHHNHVKNLLMHEIKAASQVKITHNQHQITLLRSIKTLSNLLNSKAIPIKPHRRAA